MSASPPALDFQVIDRARNLGDLLALLFTLAEVWKPKEIADALTAFDPRCAIEPNVVGRWLRNERRPSKHHLQLLVRFYQSHGLIGTRLATDRVFIRIAAHLAGIGARDIPALHPIAPARRVTEHPARLRPRRVLTETEAAEALERDLVSHATDWETFQLSPSVEEFIRSVQPPSAMPLTFADIPGPLKRDRRPNLLRRIYRAFWNDP